MDNLDFSGAGAAEYGLSVCHLQRTHCRALLCSPGPAAGTLGSKRASRPPLLSDALLFQGGEVVNDLPSRACCKIKK